MELHQDKEGNFYGRIRFGRQKAVNLKLYNGYWYMHMDDCYGTKITLGEDEFCDLKYMFTNDFAKFKEEISKKQEEQDKKKKKSKSKKREQEEDNPNKRRKNKKRVVVIPSSSSEECESETDSSASEDNTEPLIKKKKVAISGKSFLACEAKEDKS